MKTSNETLVSNLELSGNFSEVLSSIKQGQQYLTSLDIEDIILWLDAICTSWSDRQSDVQQLYSNQGINFLIYWFRKKHLLEITDLALRGNRKFLDGFHT